MPHTFHMTDTIGDFHISTLYTDDDVYETAGFRVIHSERGEKSKLVGKFVFYSDDDLSSAIQSHLDAIDFVMKHGRLPRSRRERIWECFDTMSRSEYPRIGDWFENSCWGGRVLDVCDDEEACSYVIYVAVFD